MAEEIFTFVLLYGAGVDYSLLFMSRYREFLDQRHSSVPNRSPWRWMPAFRDHRYLGGDDGVGIDHALLRAIQRLPGFRPGGGAGAAGGGAGGGDAGAGMLASSARALLACRSPAFTGRRTASAANAMAGHCPFCGESAAAGDGGHAGGAIASGRAECTWNGITIPLFSLKSDLPRPSGNARWSSGTGRPAKSRR